MDPLSPLTAPPPRYLLESDSSDEEGQGAYPGAPSRPKLHLASPSISFRSSLSSDLPHVLLAIGQAGKYILKHVGSNGEVVGEVQVEGKTAGRVVKAGEEVVLVLDENEVPNEAAWGVVEKITEGLKARSWTVLTTYVPSMYIPSTTERASRIRSDPPVRYLSSSSETKLLGAEKYEAPNYLTGVAAALVSLAAHPASPSTSTTTLLLPLPLSSLPTSIVGTALTSSSPQIASRISSQRGRWSEDDDEPWSAPGMGKVRGVGKGVGEAVGMYT
ncbi:hypothetical protein IAT38_006462 [Cryptococcus sp. DSM 104549]